MVKVSSWWVILLAGFSYTIVQYHLSCSVWLDIDQMVATKESTTIMSSSKTMLLLMMHRDNDMNRKRIAEMSSLLKNNFMVVWSSTDQPTCPFQEMKDAGLCLDTYEISESHQLSHKCCGQEMALMWAMENRHLFDNVWLMEDDVYATDISELAKLVSLDSPADLLHQEHTGNLISWDEQWPYADEVRHDVKGLFNTSDMKLSIFNIFRMSKDLLAALEEVYIDLGHEWFFFEALLPSVVVSNHFNLTHASWLEQLKDTNSTYIMTVTPRCITQFEKPGIYHPVKYKDGKFVSCASRPVAPDVIEGSPYKNQV
jgi:hypothetical protein